MALADASGPSNTLIAPLDGGRVIGGRMTNRQRMFSILIGLVGALGSCVALVMFLVTMRSNGLPLPDAPTTQAFYQSVGEAYSGGFAAGFSLCFFLTLLAVALGTWLEGRRGTLAGPTPSVPIPMVRPGAD